MLGAVLKHYKREIAQCVVMAAQVTNQLKIAEDQQFIGRPHSVSTLNVLYDIKAKLTEAQLFMIRQTCFGHLMDLQPLKFAGQLVHNVLLREVVTHGLEQEMWFNVSGSLIRFSVVEFGLVMGLTFGPKKKRPTFQGHRIRDFYFEGRRSISQERLINTFNALDFSELNDEDAVKLSLLMIVHFFVCSDTRRSIDQWLLQCVDDLPMFNSYTWGNESWDILLSSLQKAVVNGVEKYNLNGPIIAFQVCNISHSVLNMFTLSLT